ncbi:MAG: hypothetical protein Fur0046_34150 [Cyanobacteria bacterium J069]
MAAYLYKLLIISIVGLMAIAQGTGCSAERFSPSPQVSPPVASVSASVRSTNPPTLATENLGQPNGSTLDRILREQRIRVAVPQDFPPFGSLSASMQLQGYDVDVARLLAAELQVELELVPVTSDRRLSVLQADQVDVVIASLGANPQRALSIYFSRAYAPFYSGVYGTAEVSAADYAGLKGYRVGVTEASLEDAELSQKVSSEVIVQRYKTNAQTIAALLQGKVQAIATSNIVASNLIRQHPDRNLGQKFIMKNSPCYIGIRRGDLDFLQWLDVFVTSKKLSGELNALAEQWFGEPLGDLPS